MDEIDWNDLVWAVMDMSKPDGEEKTVAVYEREGAALGHAEKTVGNRARSSPAGGMHFYGPGDGTTSVMVRTVPRGLLPESIKVQ